MKEVTILSENVDMLAEDMENFIALIHCNAVEAELASNKAKHYKITITELKKK